MKFISPLDFTWIIIALIDTCARTNFIDSLSCLVEVAYYLRQVFHLKYDICVIPVDELPYFYLILWSCIIR